MLSRHTQDGTNDDLISRFIVPELIDFKEAVLKYGGILALYQQYYWDRNNSDLNNFKVQGQSHISVHNTKSIMNKNTTSSQYCTSPPSKGNVR